MPIAVLKNGVALSASNVKVVLFNVPVIGITNIKYSIKQKKENHYGLGNKPVSRGYGQYAFEGSISMYKEVWNNIIKNAPFKDPLSIPMFDIQVIFESDPGRPIQIAVDNLLACDFLEDPFSVGSGDTKIIVEIPILIGDITHVD